MKLNTLNCDKTQKLKLWENSKTQIVTKLKTEIGTTTKISPKNSKFNCDETEKSNCDETQKLKLWSNSETQIVIKFLKTKLWWNSKILIVMKLKKLKLWWKSKSQIVTKFKNWNFDKTQKPKLW